MRCYISLSNISAALGTAQLEMLNSNLDKNKINKFYSDSFLKVKGANILQSPEYSKNNKWLNLLVLDKPYKKTRAIFNSKLFNLDRYGTQIIYKKNISIAKNLKLIMQIRSLKK